MQRVKAALLITLFLPAVSIAQLDGVEYDWEQKRDKHGVTVFTSDVEGSPNKAVRGEMLIKGSVSSLVALVEDLPACPDWAAMCKEARIVERVSPTESYAYIYNDVPFPVSDRDVYVHVTWSVDPDTGQVSMHSVAKPNGVAETKAVRLNDSISQWHFTDQGDGTVFVENFAHIDPNGPTPAWITNMLLVDAPFDTMLGMRKLIENGAYADVRIEFLDATENNTAIQTQ